MLSLIARITTAKITKVFIALIFFIYMVILAYEYFILPQLTQYLLQQVELKSELKILSKQNVNISLGITQLSLRMKNVSIQYKDKTLVTLKTIYLNTNPYDILQNKFKLNKVSIEHINVYTDNTFLYLNKSEKAAAPASEVNTASLTRINIPIDTLNLKIKCGSIYSTTTSKQAIIDNINMNINHQKASGPTSFSANFQPMLNKNALMSVDGNLSGDGKLISIQGKYQESLLKSILKLPESSDQAYIWKINIDKLYSIYRNNNKDSEKTISEKQPTTSFNPEIDIGIFSKLPNAKINLNIAAFHYNDKAQPIPIEINLTSNKNHLSASTLLNFPNNNKKTTLNITTKLINNTLVQTDGILKNIPMLQLIKILNLDYDQISGIINGQFQLNNPYPKLLWYKDLSGTGMFTLEPAMFELNFIDKHIPFINLILKQLSKKITLDSKDLEAYDSIHANLELNNNILTAKNILISKPNQNIQASGSLNIPTKSINSKVTYTNENTKPKTILKFKIHGSIQHPKVKVDPTSIGINIIQKLLTKPIKGIELNIGNIFEKIK